MNTLVAIVALSGHQSLPPPPPGFLNRLAEPKLHQIVPGVDFGFGILEITERHRYDADCVLAKGVLSIDGKSIPVALEDSTRGKGTRFQGYFFYRTKRSPIARAIGRQGGSGYPGEFPLPKSWGSLGEILGAYAPLDGVEKLPSSTGHANLASMVGLLDRSSKSSCLDAWVFLDRLSVSDRDPETAPKVMTQLKALAPASSSGRLVRALLLSSLQRKKDAASTIRVGTSRHSQAILEAIRLGNPADRFFLDVYVSQDAGFSAEETTVPEIVDVANNAPWARNWLVGKLLPPTDAESYSIYLNLLDDKDTDIQLKVVRKLAAAVGRDDLMPNMLLARGKPLSIVLQPLRDFWREKSFEDFKALRKSPAHADH